MGSFLALAPPFELRRGYQWTVWKASNNTLVYLW
jgi:hypothetical protein